MHAGLGLERLVISNKDIKESYLGPEKTFMLDYDVIPEQKKGIHFEAAANTLNYGNPSDITSITDPEDYNDPPDAFMEETPIPGPVPASTPAPSSNPEPVPQPGTAHPVPTQPAVTKGPGRPGTKKLAKGKTFLYKKLKYKVSSLKGKSGTVSITATSKKNLKQAVIPATLRIQGHKLKVTSIGKNAFRNCKKLKRITIGSNIQKIGSGAFRSCIRLKKIFIQTKQLRKLGKHAFGGIPEKVSVRIPKGISRKQSKMFKNLRFS